MDHVVAETKDMLLDEPEMIGELMSEDEPVPCTEEGIIIYTYLANVYSTITTLFLAKLRAYEIHAVSEQLRFCDAYKREVSERMFHITAFIQHYACITPEIQEKTRGTKIERDHAPNPDPTKYTTPLITELGKLRDAFGKANITDSEALKRMSLLHEAMVNGVNNMVTFVQENLLTRV